MLHVTCAVIIHEEKILICQRSSAMKMPLKWEFPGGKIEANESEADCLKREMIEELGICVEVGRRLKMVIHHYTDLSICLYPFICSWNDGTLHLAEHKQAIWVTPQDLVNFDWAEADLPIVIELLQLSEIKS